MSYTYNSNVGYESPGDNYFGEKQLQSRRRISDQLVNRLSRPNAKVSILITVTAGMWLRGPEVYSGRTVRFENVPVTVCGVQMNNGEVSLTAQTSAANVVSNNGSYYYDPAAKILYVNPPDPSTRIIFDDIYQAKLVFYFAKVPKKLRSVYWQPRLVSAPDLSLRIESRFSGVGQIGGGKLSLANADGYFDELDESIQWDAGQVSMELGIDIPTSGGELSEADYQKVGTWRVEKNGRENKNFVLGLREPKTTLENSIPHREFTREEFPNIADDLIGKPIPLAWGRLFGVKPVLIDKGLKKFKVADHAIKSLEGCRVKDSTQSWIPVNFATRDLSKGEFTLGSEWTGTEEISIDLFGRTNPDGSLMENAGNIAADILDYCGETNFDADSFNIARSWFTIGRDKFGAEVCLLAPCIYLDEPRTGLEVLGEINSLCGTFLFVDYEGRWRFSPFKPSRASDLDPQAGTIIQTFTEQDIIKDSLSKSVDSSQLFSKLVVRYAERKQEGWAQIVSPETRRNQYLHNLPPLFNTTKTVRLGKTSDARYWGERFLVTEAQPLVKFQKTIPWKGFFLMPGDKAKFVFARRNINAVLELYEAHYNFENSTVKLVAGNQRGWNDSYGFWVEDTPAEPTRSGMLLWLKPENHIYSTDGDFVQTWRDSSGQRNHGTGSNGYGSSQIPIFERLLSNANGYPVVGFNAINPPQRGQRFTFPSGLASALNSPTDQSLRAAEIFAVLKPDTVTPADQENSIWRFGTPSSLFPAAAGTISEAFGLSAGAITGISGANIVSGWNLYNVSRSNANLTVRVNNVSVYNANPAQPIIFSSPTIGGSSGGTSYYDGRFAEVLLYNRVLTASERATIVQYLNDKYALGVQATGPLPDSWDDGWTDDEVATARQNSGYWSGQDANERETDMASATDSRSHESSRWM